MRRMEHRNLQVLLTRNIGIPRKFQIRITDIFFYSKSRTRPLIQNKCEECVVARQKVYSPPFGYCVLISVRGLLHRNLVSDVVD